MGELVKKGFARERVRMKFVLGSADIADSLLDEAAQREAGHHRHRPLRYRRRQAPHRGGHREQAHPQGRRARRLRRTVTVKQDLAMAAENRLAREKSPYLLAARRQPGRLVSLGRRGLRRDRERDITRSSCRSATPPATGATSSSANRSSTPGIAALLNESFVAIKLDREERPDVDDHYMQAVVGDDRRRRMSR